MILRLHQMLSQAMIHMTIINNREEGNDGYGIAMRNLDENTGDGDLESDDIVCSV